MNNMDDLGGTIIFGNTHVDVYTFCMYKYFLQCVCVFIQLAFTSCLCFLDFEAASMFFNMFFPLEEMASKEGKTLTCIANFFESNALWMNKWVFARINQEK